MRLLALLLTSCAAVPPPYVEPLPAPARPKPLSEWGARLDPSGPIRLTAVERGASVHALAFSSRRPWLALATNADVRVLDVQRNREVVRLKVPAVRRLAWTARGDLVTARVWETTWLETWAVPSGARVAKRSLPGEARGYRNDWEWVGGVVEDAVGALAPAPVGDWVAFASALHAPRLFDARTGALLGPMGRADARPHPEPRPSAMVWAPTGRRLALRRGTTLTVFDLEADAVTPTFEATLPPPEIGPSVADLDAGLPPSVAFDDGGRLSATVPDGIVRWFGPGTDPGEPRACAPAALISLPTGGWLGSSPSCDRSAFTWATPGRRTSFGARGQWAPLAASTDGARVLAGGTVAALGPRGLEVLGFLGWFRSYAWTPDLRWIATARGDALAIWRVEERRLARPGAASR